MEENLTGPTMPRPDKVNNRFKPHPVKWDFLVKFTKYTLKLSPFSTYHHETNVNSVSHGKIKQTTQQNNSKFTIIIIKWNTKCVAQYFTTSTSFNSPLTVFRPNNQGLPQPKVPTRTTLQIQSPNLLA